MRARTKPVTPNSTRQLTVRNAFQQAVNRWTETLTAAQRASWHVYAANVPRTNALGDSRQLSGQDWYVGRSTLVAQIDKALPGSTSLVQPTTAPTIFNRGLLGALELVAADAGIQVLHFSFLDSSIWNTNGGGGLAVYVQRPTNPSNNRRAPFQLARWLDGQDTEGSPASIDLSEFTTFSITANQIARIKAIALFSDGRFTSPVYAEAVVF